MSRRNAETAPLPQLGDHLLVTVKAPFYVVLNGNMRLVRAIDGELANTSDQVAVFACYRMFVPSNNGASLETITIRTTVTVRLDNIAGMWPVPTRDPPLKERP